MKMRVFPTQIFLMCVAVAAISMLTAGQQTNPDLILFGGKIFTSDAANPYVQAIAIRGDRIVAVGDSAQLKSLAGVATKQIDLQGRTVIPGINDAHNHIAVLPPNWFEMEFKSLDPSVEEVDQTIAASAATKPKGTILFGNVAGKVFHDVSVNRDSLDKITSTDPVIIQTITGHAMIMNSAALALVDVSGKQADPMGGRFERFPDGRLSGVIREYAVLQMNRKLTSLASESEAISQLRDFFAQATKFGITSIQDMSDSFTPERAVALFEKTPTPVRVRIMRMPGTTSAGRDTREGWPASKISNPLITVNGMKWMLDGVAIEGTLLPRDDKTSTTDLVRSLPLTFPASELTAMLHESLAHDEPLMVHVSAYPSAAAMLKAMESTGGPAVWADKRVRFEHGDGLFPDLIPEAKKLGVVVVQNPTHFDLVPLVGDGFARLKAQPLRALLVAGIPVALGSDGPMNPYLNIMLATVHPNCPTEAITREQAVTAYTLTSAYAEFAEKQKGSLAPGKLADLAVLSQDIFTVPTQDLPKTESVLTLVGGKTVYDAGVLKN
jgi:predicted amidohydrolase YtcJ